VAGFLGLGVRLRDFGVRFGVGAGVAVGVRFRVGVRVIEGGMGCS